MYIGKATRRTLWRYLVERGIGSNSDAPLFTTIHDEPLSRDGLRLIFVRLGKTAGLRKCHPHMFRHTFAINYLRSQGDVLTLQVLLGHESLEMVKRYARIAKIDLLTPADFGIIAMVAVTLHFFDLLSDVGNQQYLVQKDKVTVDDFNTAWSIEIIMKVLLAAVLFIVAPWIADFFSEPRLILAIQVITVVLPIKALKNPALTQLARDLDYKKLVYLQVLQKLLSFVAVIIVVFINTSYWALIVGDVTAAIVFTGGSYYIVRYRPKWSLMHIKEQWQFSQWLLFRSILGYFRAQLDIGFVSKFFGSTLVGGYNMTRELALMPASNLLIPALEPLLAAIAKSKHDAQIIAYRVRFSLFFLLIIIVPLSVFIWFFSYEIVNVILGHQWTNGVAT